MQHSRLPSFAITVLLITSALSCSSDKSTHSERMKILDTHAIVSIANTEAGIAQDAIKSVEHELKTIDHIGYTITDGCELQQLNEAFELGESFEASAELIELIQKSKLLSLQSHGLFNPAAGELVSLWQYSCNSGDCVTPPYPDEVMKLVELKENRIIDSNPKMSDITIKGNHVRSSNRAVKLEFGELIRGFALDKGIEHLKSQNIHDAMIDIGDSVRVIGRRGNHPWWVGLYDASGKHMLGTIELADDSAVVTARAVTKAVTEHGTVYRHVIDPRNGLPARGIASVTVIHNSAAIADVAASALLVSGRKKWKQVAANYGVTALIIFDDDGTIYMSPAMSNIIHWKQRLPHKLLVP